MGEVGMSEKPIQLPPRAAIQSRVCGGTTLARSHTHTLAHSHQAVRRTSASPAGARAAPVAVLLLSGEESGLRTGEQTI